MRFGNADTPTSATDGWRANEDSVPDEGADDPAGGSGLRHGELSRRVFDAMRPRFEDYAADPEVRGPARQNTRDALRRVIEYFLYRDLERGWRVTAPNLEDCGLLRFEYEGLGGKEGLLGETELWDSGFPVQEGRGSQRFVEAPATLRLAPAEAREEILRTLLDMLRRALAVKVDVLDPRKQRDLVERTKSGLLEGTVWYLDDERELAGSVVAWPRPRRKGERGGFFVSSYGAYGQYVKRTLEPHPAPGQPRTQPLRRADTGEIIRFLFLALKRYGIVEQVRSGRDGDDPGYQLNADAQPLSRRRPAARAPSCGHRRPLPAGGRAQPFAKAARTGREPDPPAHRSGGGLRGGLLLLPLFRDGGLPPRLQLPPAADLRLRAGPAPAQGA